MLKDLYGFSIAETLVVITLLSILSSSFWATDITSFYERWKSNNVFNRDVASVLSLISKARSLAIEAQRPVYLCGGDRCQGDWSDTIFIRFPDSETAQSSWSLSSKTIMVWRGFPVSRQFIEFLPNGLSSYQNGSFYLCFEELFARRILINQSGRAYLETPTYSMEVCQ
ncbi:GspH/FimT family pseudopilin [Marinomonas ostreistagni]|uniref:GspH/FimT family pseudopilin n=1 Tax=Marinomonas ostreistagni TaxID=359209 RepID=A0ABS0ZB56_9GAMM|nr:GspH/FimT family pseudopilin [Marinomonas ostreistagni]MBJ7550638.1 GspH/FimT family pseudopilin [Marinomonas ostreistagni]